MSLESDTLILEALTKLAIARGAVPDGEQNDVYLDSLAPYDPDLIRRVCFALRTKARQEYEPALPSVGVLIGLVEELARSDAQQASQKLLGAMPRRHQDEPTFYCVVCFDTGFEDGWCPGRGPQRMDISQRHERHSGRTTEACNRDQSHVSHTWARPCGCRHRNPVWAREQQRQAAFVAGRKEKGR